MGMSEREHHIDWLCRLKSNLKVFIPKDFHLAEFEQSLDYAISSLKTDEAYQLEYENRDTLEVIRCKDCSYWDRSYVTKSRKHPCSYLSSQVSYHHTPADGYCYKAKRIKEQTDGII